MSRFTKELKRIREEKIVGLTPDEVKAFDQKESLMKSILAEAERIHKDEFSEEYDFMYDESVDIKDRKKGINPMSEEYITKINYKREAIGVAPLAKNGMASSDNDTYKFVLMKVIQKRFQEDKPVATVNELMAKRRSGLY